MSSRYAKHANAKLHAAGRHTKSMVSDASAFFKEPVTIGALLLTGVGVYMWSQEAKKNVDMDNDLKEIEAADADNSTVASLANRIRTHAKAHSGVWMTSVGIAVLGSAAFFHFYVYKHAAVRAGKPDVSGGAQAEAAPRQSRGDAVARDV